MLANPPPPGHVAYLSRPGWRQFPGVTSGVDLDSDQLAALASHPNIVATKLTCGNVGKLTRLTSKFEPAHFGVFGGSSDYLLPTLHAGGNGCVTG